MSERRKRPRHAYWKGLDNPEPKAARAVPPDEALQIDAVLAADEQPIVTGYANDVDDTPRPDSNKQAFDEAEPALHISTSADQPPGNAGWEGYLTPDALFTDPPKHVAESAAPAEAPRSTDAGRAARLTPPIPARRDIVSVLVSARFDAWYDQWMLQAKDAAEAEGVDFFDDAVGMLEPAAAGMALAALRAHLDAHKTTYATAGLTLLVEPCVPEGDALACLLGVFEAMHEDEHGRRDDGELPFVKAVEQAALAVPTYGEPDSPFPRAKAARPAIRSSRRSMAARSRRMRRWRRSGRTPTATRWSSSR